MFLHVHTHVREDAIVLFGFAHADERRCFEALLGAHLYLVAKLGTTAPPWTKAEKRHELRETEV